MSDMTASPEGVTPMKPPSQVAAETRKALEQSAELPKAPSPTVGSPAAALGEVCYLLSQSPFHKHFFFADMAWMVLPPLIAGQYRLFYSGTRVVGVALWAKVSEEVHERLQSGVTRLRPTDWASGEKLWLIELIAPFGAQDEMLRDLTTNVLKGQTMHMHRTDEDGRQTVHVINLTA